MVKKYEVITLGSATLDVFVKAKSEIFKHRNHTDIAYHLGEKILIKDLEFTSGGGGTNNAVGFSRLGLKTGFIGILGNDDNANLILNDLKKENVDFLGCQKKGKTGYSVILAGEKDRTILAYKGINDKLKSKYVNLNNIKTNWFYCTTMMNQSHKASIKIMRHFKNSGSKIGINISLYLAKMGINKNKEILRLSDVIILNFQEAQAITNKENIQDIYNEFYKYTNAIIVITDGSRAIHASDSKNIYFKNFKPIKPVDTTGAGDAFATGFIYGLIKNKSVPESINLGHKEALSVLKGIGAKNTLLKKL